MPSLRSFGRNGLLIGVLAIFIDLSGLYTWLHHELVPPPLPQAWAQLSLSPAHLPLEHVQVLGPDRGHASSFRFCEDATPWTGHEERNLVIVSCDKWRKHWNTVLGPLGRVAGRGKGSLWLVDAGEARPVAREFELVGWPGGFEFHPLGVEVAQDGRTMLVVNHRVEASTIEVFHLESPAELAEGERPKARFQFSLEHQAFTAPNAIAAISPNSFYLSHDHLVTKRFSGIWYWLVNKLESIVGLPVTRVDIVHFSGPSDPEGAKLHVEPVARGISFANGVVLSRDGRTLAVSSTAKHKVLMYDRDPATDALTYRESVSVPFSVDNLSRAPVAWLEPEGQDDGTDAFIAAGHPHKLSMLKVIGNRNPASVDESWPGSWVVALSPRKEGAGAAKQEAGQEEDGAAAFPVSRRSKRSNRWRVDTLFQSHGRPTRDATQPPAFMTSTTGVGGRTGDGRNWLLIPGLYSEGVRLVRQVLLK